MALNDRFARTNADDGAPLQTPAQESGHARRLPLRTALGPNVAAAPPALETHPRSAESSSRPTSVENAGLQDDLTGEEGDRWTTDRERIVVPPTVLSRDKRVGHGEEEMLIYEDSALRAGGDDGGKSRVKAAAGAAAGGGGRDTDVVSRKPRGDHHNRLKHDDHHQTPGKTTSRPASSANQPTRTTAAEGSDRDTSAATSQSDIDASAGLTEKRRGPDAASVGTSSLSTATAAGGGPSAGGLGYEVPPSRQAGAALTSADAPQLQGRQGASDATSNSFERSSFTPLEKESVVPMLDAAIVDSNSGFRSTQSRSSSAPSCPPQTSRYGSSPPNGERHGRRRNTVGCDGSVTDLGTDTVVATEDADGRAAVSPSYLSSTMQARVNRPESVAIGAEENDIINEHYPSRGDGSSGSRRGGDGIDGSQQQASFDFNDRNLEVGRPIAASETGTSPNIERVLRTGCSGHGRHAASGSGSIAGTGGCKFSLSQGITVGPASAYSQALHMVLAFIVFILVACHKAGDSGPSRSYSSAGTASSAGSRTTTGAGGRLASGKKSAKSSSGGGGDRDSNRRSSTGSFRRRRSSSGVGFSVKTSPFVLRLRAMWSKMWHAAEKDLATRWRAAGQALATLREAWAALWVPTPHAEADVLAEALASPPRFRYSGERGHRSVAGGRSSTSDRRRRRSRNSGRSSRGAGGGGMGSSSGSTEDGRASRDHWSSVDVRRTLGLNFLNHWGFRPLSGPGRGRSSRSPKFLLVLDLDETLVHCSPHPLDPAARRLRTGGSGTIRPDLKVEIRVGAPSDRPACMYAWKRPHLDLFLAVVGRWFEVAVFTSARQCYAEPLIDLLDSRHLVIGKRYYRDSCIRRDGGSPIDKDSAGFRSSPPSSPRTPITPLSSSSRVSRVGEGLAADAGLRASGTAATPTTADAVAAAGLETVKDLSILDSEHFPQRTVLVDNQPRTVLQQSNVLPVRSWFPKDADDRQLLDLLPVLLALTSCQDVRSVLSLRPGAGGPDVAREEAVQVARSGASSGGR